MTTGVHQLIVSLVDDLFGPICAKTISTILQHSQASIREMIEKTGFDRRTVNQCLCVLIKHRFVRYMGFHVLFIAWFKSVNVVS